MKKINIMLVALTAISINIAKAQVTIGKGSNPDESAVLELDTDEKNKGFLAPRLSLKNATDVETIPNPAVGLMVYNLGEKATLPVQGFLYWNGHEWRNIDDSPLATPTIEDLICPGASLSPIYTQNATYSGYISIPYTGGNGAKYDSSAQTGGPVTVNGLTCTLQPGRLNVGSGDLYFKVTGVANVPSTTPIKFPINVFGVSCDATVGGTVEIKVIQYAVNKVSPIDANTPTASVTRLGNLEVRYNGKDLKTAYNIEFRSIVPNHISFIYHKAGTGGHSLENYGQAKSEGIASKPNDWFTFDQINEDISGNTNININPANRDLASTIFTLHNTKEVYRLTLNANGSIDGFKAIPAAPSAVTFFLEKLE